jgi:membrane protein required for colicin V production
VDSLPINLTDIIVLTVLVLSAAFAFVRGFVHEMLAIGSWVGAALATLYGFPYAQPIAREHIPSPLIADMVAGIAIFLVVLVALSIVTRLLCKRVRNSGMGPLDRSLGLVFGVARGAVLVCIAWLMLLWVMPREDHPEWITEARTLPLIEKGGAMIASIIPDGLGGRAARATQAPDAQSGSSDPYQLLVRPSARANAASNDKDGYKGVERDAMQQLIEATTQGQANAKEPSQ